MPFHDLHVAYTNDHATLSSTLSFAKELGYETIAVSVAVTGILPPQPPSIPLAAITKPDKLRVLTRLTLTVSDTTMNHRLPSLASHYNIIALRPTNEKSLQQCCSNLECDLISLDFSQRLPCPLRFTTVASALQRGIRFEICYSPGIVAGADARRNLICGATQLIRATRGRGIILSSDARSALGLRAPWDVINLAQVWGLSQQRAKEALCEEAGKVFRLAGMKRTSFRGVVDIVDNGAQHLDGVKEEEVQPSKRTSSQQKPRQQKDKETVTLRSQTTANGVKRKASISASNVPHATQKADERPVSKSEMKRRAKKARLEGQNMSDTSTNDRSKGVSLQHESLMSNNSK